MADRAGRRRAPWAVSPCCDAPVMSKSSVVIAHRVREDGSFSKHGKEQGVSTDGDPYPCCDKCGKYVDGLTDQLGWPL